MHWRRRRISSVGPSIAGRSALQTIGRVPMQMLPHDACMGGIAFLQHRSDKNEQDRELGGLAICPLCHRRRRDRQVNAGPPPKRNAPPQTKPSPGASCQSFSTLAHTNDTTAQHIFYVSHRQTSRALTYDAYARTHVRVHPTDAGLRGRRGSVLGRRMDDAPRSLTVRAIVIAF